MRFFEDFLDSVGDSIELGSDQVTEASILEFARAYDPQPFHVDPELARASIYGGLIASGWHTAAIYMRMLVDHLLRDTASLGSPGVDELRWYLPVRPGDTLRGRITLLEARVSQSKPERGLLRTRGELFNQDDQCVMRLVAVNFFSRRPS
jgi:acyl dehydratase